MNQIYLKKVIDNLIILIKQIVSVNSCIPDFGCVDGEIIGTGRSDYTHSASTYCLSIDSKKFALIDIPGIEGDESNFEEIIKESLEKAHMIYYVNGSGKKIENESLKKIKKYMHDGTSVYAIFNTHCKAKKERIPGIDKSYSEELEDAYKKQEDIISQTEAELRSILGSNYKGSINMNGLLAFCSVAFGFGEKTSIKEEKDKNLRNDQKKYLNEYNLNREQMFKDSHLQEICNAIGAKSYTYKSDILNENIKKLRNRMSEMIDRVYLLKTGEIRKIYSFINSYNEFESSCKEAKDDFIRNMKHVGINAANEGFYDLMEEIFNRIEEDGGKTKDKDIQAIVDERKDEVIEKIQNGINKKILYAQKAFDESIEDAKERLRKDIEREQLQFEVILSSENVGLDIRFEECLKYNIKDFGKSVSTIGSLALSGAFVGSMITPGLGTAIGAAIGVVLGLIFNLWNIFLSRDKRISNAKEKIRHEIDSQIYEVSDQINEELSKLNYEQRINEIYESIYNDSEKQKNKLLEIKRLLENVERDLMGVYKNIA